LGTVNVDINISNKQCQCGSTDNYADDTLGGLTSKSYTHTLQENV